MSEYPTEEELKTIETWDYTKGVKTLLDFIEHIWHWPEFGFKLKGKKVLKLELHTGGWSGNEEIIQALHESMFWALYWEKTRRGGHFYFTIRPIKKQVLQKKKEKV